MIIFSPFCKPEDKTSVEYQKTCRSPEFNGSTFYNTNGLTKSLQGHPAFCPLARPRRTLNVTVQNRPVSSSACGCWTRFTPAYVLLPSPGNCQSLSKRADRKSTRLNSS